MFYNFHSSNSESHQIIIHQPYSYLPLFGIIDNCPDSLSQSINFNLQERDMEPIQIQGKVEAETETEIQKFQKELPIYEYKVRILDMVRDNLFNVITGDTGSGKSTQLPQYLADSEELKADIISKMSLVEEYRTNKVPEIKELRVVTTQPRRMAAVSMAHRLCQERNQKLGKKVGYTIRFEDKTSKQTVLKYVTDGIFVKECISDPYLFKYHVVILDEAHERSLYTDVLFALVKKAVEYRKGTLRLVVTSATLNTKTFSTFYGNCPVLQMHGKLFPVQVKYHQVRQNERVDEAAKAVIRIHLHEGPGDILVFLTGSEECEQATRITYERLEDLMEQGKQVPGMIIYSFYGALSNEDQARVFEPTPEGIRKVVYSTNIAETSLTINGIAYVVDSGYVKQKTYNPKTNMDSLVTIPISKVQAIQRKGRAGRTQEGKCVRLYTQKFYDEMKEYTIPEILRVSLTNVVLTLKSMKITDVINFDYMETPDHQAIFKALTDLYLLQALNQKGEITELGLQMCKFPLQPSYSKALIASLLFQVEEKMITLVSMLSTQGIWKKVLKINQKDYNEFMQKQKQLLHPSGDHQTLLNIYKKWTDSDNSHKFCDDYFINARSLKQTDNIKNQLYQLIKICNIDVCKQFFKNDHNYQIHLKESKEKTLKPEYIKTLLRKALSIGFYYNTAKRMNNAEQYILLYPEGTIVAMDPMSALALNEKDPRHVVFTELGSGYGRGIMKTISAIDQLWIQPYISKTKDIDIFMLAGMKFEEKKIEVVAEESEESKKRRREKELEDKLSEAKLKYEQRKKMRKIG